MARTTNVEKGKKGFQRTSPGKSAAPTAAPVPTSRLRSQLIQTLQDSVPYNASPEVLYARHSARSNLGALRAALETPTSLRAWAARKQARALLVQIYGPIDWRA